jgi:hypothetical protein
LVIDDLGFRNLCLLAGYRLPAGKHAGILTDFRTKVNKKTGQNFGRPALPAQAGLQLSLKNW